MTQDFQTKLNLAAKAVNVELDFHLPKPEDNILGAPMRYAVLNGGKRFRAFLAFESAKMFGVDNKKALGVAAAIETMHAYSLVHDDLPCMDDDDRRRGLPTVHVKWNEATAVLVGDALQCLSFEILCGISSGADVRLALITSLGRAAGAKGMVLGQAHDMAAEGNLNLSLDEVSKLQRYKTGALIEWATTVGAVLTRQFTGPLVEYATAIGQAFQITDDILDIEGDPELLGKRVAKDGRAGKATFVSLLGVEGAKKRSVLLVQEACDVLFPYGAAAETLREAAHFVIKRKT